MGGRCAAAMRWASRACNVRRSCHGENPGVCGVATWVGSIHEQRRRGQERYGGKGCVMHAALNSFLHRLDIRISAVGNSDVHVFSATMSDASQRGSGTA